MKATRPQEAGLTATKKESWLTRLSHARTLAGRYWTMPWKETMKKPHGQFLLDNICSMKALSSYCKYYGFHIDSNNVCKKLFDDEEPAVENPSKAIHRMTRLSVLHKLFKKIGIWRFSWRQTIKRARGERLIRLTNEYMKALSAVYRYSRIPVEISGIINDMMFA